MKTRLTHSALVLFVFALVSISACSNTTDNKVTVKETRKGSMVEQLAAQQSKKTKPMSQQALIKLMTHDLSGYTLLDVRTPEEFSEGHIAGAVNISHDQILQNIGLLDKYKDTHLIVYCRSGRRASLVTDLLEQQSYLKDIYHLQGDMLGWQKAGLERVE